MSHTCHAADCDRVIPPRLLMCMRHWRAVPAGVQRLIWVTYAPGQEERKDPTIAYLAVQSLAVAIVAKSEKRAEQAYHAMLRALKYTQELPEDEKYDIIRGRIASEVLL